ncbi:MAG: hypothetical protein JW819_11830 [Candidatus Krumholzibacteriota bacterium]|nr:hypothetical protein [Candidatus Krumholzibacteriota bacterium]
MRKVFFITVLLLLVAAVPALADSYNILKEGFSFFEGSTVGAIGRLEPLQTQNPPINWDFDSYEVTWALLDMTVVAETPMGPFIQYELEGGTVALYEDPLMDLDYGDYPADGIPTATNGTVALSGDVVSAILLFSTMTETGNFDGTMFFTGGSRYPELEALGIGLFEWLIFDGVSADEAVGVPPGYHSRFAGRFYTLTTPVDDTTWTKVRSLY